MRKNVAWPAQPPALLAYLGNDNTVLEPGVFDNRFSEGLVFWSQVLAVTTPVTPFINLSVSSTENPYEVCQAA